MVHSIQGGGEGAGIKPPRQILQLEPEIAMTISKEILLSSGNTNLPIGTESQGGGSENEGEIYSVQDEKMEVWKKELQQRLFLLHQRKKESSSAMS